MDINHHVIMLNLELPLILFLFCLSTFSNVGAQPLCPGNSITIKDSVTGAFQCQDCLKCPSGEGLSVDCGDIVSSKTPLVCRSCVLGETRSSAYEAGACKGCENCGDYRETTTNCTLSSKAECGNCTSGAYPEAMLGMCKPCSPCCNDGKDIIVPECQAPGVSINMQCSFLRSEKCGKATANANVEASTVETDISATTTTAASNHSPFPLLALTQIPAPESMGQGKQQAYPTNGTSLNWEVIGPAIAGALAVLILLAFIVGMAIRYFKNKRKQVCKKGDDDVEMQQVQDKDEPASESDGSSSEADAESNPGDALLGEAQVPFGITETGESSLSTGVKETGLPGSQRSPAFTTAQKPRPEPNAKVHTTTTKTRTFEETTVEKTTVTCNADPWAAGVSSN